MIVNPYAYAGAGGSYDAETVAWASLITGAGGSVTTQEKDWADALILAIQGATYGAKIMYLLPFLGTSVTAHRAPLRDTLGAGLATSVGFVDADCTNNGIDNSAEAAKYFNTGVLPSALGSSNNAGMGHYERNWGAGTNVEPIGCYNGGNTERFLLDLRSSMQRFRYGDPTGSQAGPGTTASNGHYYGQRSSSTLREIYKDGSSLGSDGTSSEAASGANSQTIAVMGCRGPASAYTPWKGRCAVAYLTDGTMSSGDISAFHTLLGTYLITPTGR